MKNQTNKQNKFYSVSGLQLSELEGFNAVEQELGLEDD